MLEALTAQRAKNEVGTLPQDCTAWAARGAMTKLVSCRRLRTSGHSRGGRDDALRGADDQAMDDHDEQVARSSARSTLRERGTSH